MHSKVIALWVGKIGRSKALARLIENEVGTRTAEMLVDGKYFHEPRGRILRILTGEMQKDGFYLADKKAS